MRILVFLLLSVPWLGGCTPVYTTHLVSGPNSFVTDERLVGGWNFGSLYIEHNSELGGKLYAIEHKEHCAITPIYTTQINGDWFMNVDVTGKFRCVNSEKILIEDHRLQEFNQLYHLVKYRIKTIPLNKLLLEDFLPNLDAALQILEENRKEEFIKVLDELEQDIGVKIELTDLEGGRLLLARLRTLLNQLFESDEFGDQVPVLEVLEIESMQLEVVKDLVADGRLAGEIKYKSTCSRDDRCPTIVITDTADNVASLVQTTGKTLFPHQHQEPDNVKKDPLEKLAEQAEAVFDSLFSLDSEDSPTFFRLVF